MTRTRGKYLLAVDRRCIIDGRVEELKAFAVEARTRPIIEVIQSGEAPSPFLADAQQIVVADYQRTVASRIAALPYDHANSDHAVVVVTHEGLRQSDLSGFDEWRLVIDETPTIFEMGAPLTPAMQAHLSTHYTLSPMEGTAWSTVSYNERRDGDEIANLTVSALRRDEALSGWAAFHKRVTSSQGVMCSLSDWSEVASGRAWNWWSLWSPEELEAFASVTICAHAFRESLTARIWGQVWSSCVEFERVVTPQDRVWTPRSVVVRYIATHTAGSYWWDTAEGRRCLLAWTGWIAREYPVGGPPHLMTCNTKLRDMLAQAGIGGVFPTPRVAGSNEWSAVHAASILYAAKPSPHERLILDQLGVSADDVIRAREHEDVIQIAMRTSLRDPASAASVTINVYDAVQADVLARYLRSHYPFSVTVESVDVGIGDVIKPKRGRPLVVKSDAEIALQQATRRHRRAAQQRRRRAGAAPASQEVHPEGRM